MKQSFNVVKSYRSSNVNPLLMIVWKEDHISDTALIYTILLNRKQFFLDNVLISNKFYLN